MNLAWRITFFFIISKIYKNTILNNLNYTDTIRDSKYCIDNNISVSLMSAENCEYSGIFYFGSIHSDSRLYFF